MTQPPNQPPTDAPKDPPAKPPADPSRLPDDQPLAAAGLKALQEEREARKALEKRLAALEPLAKVASALAGGDRPDGRSDVELLTERLAGHEKTLTEERAARWRAEVAHEKGLTPGQARRLAGGTREEMLADADDLIASFPAVATPRTPGPDPSQGARGGQPADVEAQIKEAQTKRDWKTVLRLQNQKLADLAAKTRI